MAHPLLLDAAENKNNERHSEPERERTQHCDRGDHALVQIIAALIIIVVVVVVIIIIRGIVGIIGIIRFEVFNPINDLVVEIFVG